MPTYEASSPDIRPEAWESIKETTNLMEEYHRTPTAQRTAKFTEAVYLRLRFCDPLLVVGRESKSIYSTVPDGTVIETPQAMPNR